MSNILLFNKPMNVLSQFTDSASDNKDQPRKTLRDYIPLKGFYPAGRLDYDSEGLLILTDDGKLQARISHPDYKMPKTYWVQVEGKATEEACEKLRKGVRLNDGPTLPARVKCIDPPDLWPRNPPVRIRNTIPTSWLSIEINEGRNRQVRRMTAHVNLPTLRLIRVSIGPWSLAGIQPGNYATSRVNLPVQNVKRKTSGHHKPRSKR